MRKAEEEKAGSFLNVMDVENRLEKRNGVIVQHSTGVYGIEKKALGFWFSPKNRSFYFS